MFVFGLAVLSAAPAHEKDRDGFCDVCLKAIGGGDKDALRALYEQTKTAVYAFALSITRNKADAEDVLQDTFISVYHAAAGYKPMGKPLAWILRIARNLALMKIRGGKRNADVSDEAWASFAADAPAVTPEERLLLSGALQQIAPEESQIVILHAVAGFKHREIAAMLTLPLSTVLSKYNRAIKKLQRILE